VAINLCAYTQHLCMSLGNPDSSGRPWTAGSASMDGCSNHSSPALPPSPALSKVLPRCNGAQREVGAGQAPLHDVLPVVARQHSTAACSSSSSSSSRCSSTCCQQRTTAAVAQDEVSIDNRQNIAAEWGTSRSAVGVVDGAGLPGGHWQMGRSCNNPDRGGPAVSGTTIALGQPAALLQHRAAIDAVCS
jgi:hypothetical protein